MRREKLDLMDSKKARVPMRYRAEAFVVAMKPRNGGGAKGMRHSARRIGQPGDGMNR